NPAVRQAHAALFAAVHRPPAQVTGLHVEGSRRFHKVLHLAAVTDHDVESVTAGQEHQLVKFADETGAKVRLAVIFRAGQSRLKDGQLLAKLVEDGEEAGSAGHQAVEIKVESGAAAATQAGSRQPLAVINFHTHHTYVTAPAAVAALCQ